MPSAKPTSPILSNSVMLNSSDLIKSLNQDLVIIRGLRNTKDFLYEQKQYRYNQDLMPNIKVINVFCDKEFEHISSSGIRTLEKYNKHQNYLLD